MGCAFNAVIVPKEVQTHEDLLSFYEDYRAKLLEEYGGEEFFKGYSGDLAVDDGSLVVTDLMLPYDGPELAVDDTEHWDNLLELCGDHCEKWGPSIAVRIGAQWAICGAYSD